MAYLEVIAGCHLKSFDEGVAAFSIVPANCTLQEDIFELFKKTWDTLCSSLVMSMTTPQNYENQVMIGLIMPEAVKMLSYLLNNIIQKRVLAKNFEDLLLHLIPVIIFMMLENTENQLKFSLYRGLQTVVYALIKLDKLFYIVPHSEILVKNLLEVLCVAVNENKDNCIQAGTLGVLSILINLLFKVKDVMSVLLTMSQLLYDCDDNMKVFIKEGGILVLPTAVKKLNFPPSVINVVKFLQRLCEKHIYGNKLLNSSIVNQNEIKDSHLSSNSTLLEVNYDESKCVINDSYLDGIKRVDCFVEKKLPSNLSSEILTHFENRGNRKHKITNKFKKHPEDLYDRNEKLSVQEWYSSPEVTVHRTHPNCQRLNTFQRTNENKLTADSELNLSSKSANFCVDDLFIDGSRRVNCIAEKKLSSNILAEINTPIKNTNDRQYKISSKFKRGRTQHYAHTDVLSDANYNLSTNECYSSLEHPMNVTPASCSRLSTIQRTNENKCMDSNTSQRLFIYSSCTETQAANGVLFKTLLPAHDPGVISALYYKTMVDKVHVDNVNSHLHNINPNSKQPPNTKYQSELKNTFSNQFNQSIYNITTNVIANKRSEVISTECLDSFSQGHKTATLNNTDLKRKTDINFFLDKMSDMEHCTEPLIGEACTQNLEYSRINHLNINNDHEVKQSDVRNGPLVTDAKVLRHFFSRKSENALKEVLYGDKMELNKDKDPSKKKLNQNSLKINAKKSEKSSSVRKNFYKILMEKSKTNLQMKNKHKLGKKDSPNVSFSEEELKNLVSGVSKFGLDFKTIRRAYVFHKKRTSKELYLKWKMCFMTTVNDS